MVDIKEQVELFSLIGKEAKSRIEAFVLGGSAMMFYGLKNVTKDIDLVFDREKDFLECANTLKRIGFKSKIRETGFRIINPSKSFVFLQQDDKRVDLFLGEIVCFKLTQSIKERATQVHEFDNFIAKVVSPEDIILAKSMTERAGDRLDVKEITEKTKIDWQVIIEEAINQTKLSEFIFPSFLYEFLLELKLDLNVEIPQEVLKKLRKIAEQEMLKRMKS